MPSNVEKLIWALEQIGLRLNGKENLSIGVKALFGELIPAPEVLITSVAVMKKYGIYFSYDAEKKLQVSSGDQGAFEVLVRRRDSLNPKKIKSLVVGLGLSEQQATTLMQHAVPEQPNVEKIKIYKKGSWELMEIRGDQVSPLTA